MGSAIDWQKMGITLAGICQNGLEAFDMIVDESPDIVVTDICMPGFSGLDLIEKVHSSKMDIEFVILSGYGEFEYAKKAMEYGVQCYLLKPCDEKQIQNAMQKAISSCEKKRQAKIREDLVSARERIIRTVREMGSSVATEDSDRRVQTITAFADQVSNTNDLSLAKAITVQFLLSFWQAADGVSQLSWINLLLEVNEASNTQQILELAMEGISHSCPVPKMDGKYKEYIRKCISYTNAHYGDASLTLKWICENVLFMNEDYVSKQFMQQTGEKYSAYLGKIRIKNAELLLMAGEKVNSVAQQVGCGNNPQYFSQMFKKYTGMSPKNWQILNEK